MQSRRRQCLASLAALAAPSVHAAQLETGEWPDEKLDGRRFRLVVPPSLAGAQSPALVIALHGMGRDSKDLMPRYTGFSESAHRHDLCVAYAQALPSGWGQGGAALRADLEFLDALRDGLIQRLGFNPRRLHLLGFSSGARLALKAAAARPGRYASLVLHSPLLPLPATAGLPPQLWIHGERDRLVPIARVRAALKAAQAARLRAELIEVPGLGHQWARQAEINLRIWTFMALQTLGR